jgi:hypothetical protein
VIGRIEAAAWGLSRCVGGDVVHSKVGSRGGEASPSVAPGTRLFRNVLVVAERMGKTDPRLGPWLEQLRVLARSYQMRKLQELLEGSPAAPSSHAVQRW